MHAAALLLTLGLASSVIAAPAPIFKRQAAADNAACQALFNLCYSDLRTYPFGVNGFGTNAFNQLSCLAVASCYATTAANDDLLRDLTAQAGQSNPPTSANSDKLYTKTWSLLARDQDKLTAQLWIDNFYMQLARTQGPYPSSAGIIIEFYNQLAAWTGFCDGSGIPLSNVRDYFKYSASVPANGCPTLPTATVTFKPAIAAGTATTTLPVNTATQYPSADNGACDALYRQCHVYAGNPTNVFSSTVCVLTATCQAANSDDLVLRLVEDDYLFNQDTRVILSAAQPRLSAETFHSMTYGADVISQQNFIDAFYNKLADQITGDGAPPGADRPVKSNNSGPYPTDVSYVQNIFTKIQAWTGYCGQNIPYSNFADYLNYAATTTGAGTSC